MELSTANLQTRSRRAKIATRNAPYWVCIGQRGKYVGYRRAQEHEPGVWLARLYAEGRWRQSRLGFTDDCEEADGIRVLTLLQAKEKALEWFPVARAEAEGVAQHRGRYKVATALEDYFADCRRRGMKEENVRRAECAAKAHIIPTLGDVAVDGLSIGRVKKWMGDLANLPARKRSRKDAAIAYRPKPQTQDERRARRDTVNRVLTILKAALNSAVELRRVPVANAFAWREVKPFAKADSARTLVLTVVQQQNLVAKCDQEFGQLVRGGLYSGARYGELRQVEIRHYDRSLSLLHIPPEIAKNGKARHIHLDLEGKQFFDAISAHRSTGEPLFVRSSSEITQDGATVHREWRRSEQARAMRRACKAASIDPFPFYTLRHTCAARWLAGGVPMAYVAAQLGNSVAICEKYYGHLAPSHIADAIRRMPRLGLARTKRRSPALVSPTATTPTRVM